MSKPIEPGCKCVVVDADTKSYIGEIVTITGKEYLAFSKSTYWGTNFVGFDSPVVFREDCLRRIDDDEQELSSWEQVEKDCGFNPTKEVA